MICMSRIFIIFAQLGIAQYLLPFIIEEDEELPDEFSGFAGSVVGIIDAGGGLGNVFCGDSCRGFITAGRCDC